MVLASWCISQTPVGPKSSGRREESQGKAISASEGGWGSSPPLQHPSETHNGSFLGAWGLSRCSWSTDVFCLAGIFIKILKIFVNLEELGDFTWKPWFLAFLFFFFSGHAIQHVGSEFPNQWTRVPCIGSAESQPLDCQGIPWGKGLEQTFSQRRGSNGHPIREKVLNITSQNHNELLHSWRMSINKKIRDPDEKEGKRNSCVLLVGM